MFKKILFIVAISLLIPSTSYAFSFDSLFSSKRHNNHSEERTPEKLNEYEMNSANEKYDNWKEAREVGNVSLGLTDNNSFTISEKEINYLVTKVIEDTDNPLFSDLNINLNDNLIKLKGHIEKPWRGRVELDFTIKSENDKLVINIVKTKFQHFFIPAFIIDRYFMSALEESLEFLYSYPSYMSINIISNDDELNLNYEFND